MQAVKKYNLRADKVNSLLCVGLDSDFEKLPEKFKTLPHPQYEFNKYIIDATARFAAAFKPNMAFYEARGSKGLEELKMTMDYLRQNFPDVFTISDAKRADIGSTNNGYVAEIFDFFGFDALTLNPYLGREALEPFLSREERGCIILCRTSNPGAGEFQDLQTGGQPLWQAVAEKVSKEWNSQGNCMLVVGATYPEEMKKVREIVGDLPLLVPGIGAQGGDVRQAVEAGLNSEKKGMIVNSSRAVIFSKNPAGAAKALRDEINLYR